MQRNLWINCQVLQLLLSQNIANVDQYRIPEILSLCATNKTMHKIFTNLLDFTQILLNVIYFCWGDESIEYQH